MSGGGATSAAQLESDARSRSSGRLDLLDRAHCHDLAGAHDRDPIRERLRLVHEMGREQDRLALVAQAADRRPGVPACARVEAGGRFVEKQQIRVAADADRHVEPTPLAAGQLADADGGPILETDQLEHLVALSWHRVVAAVHVDDLGHGQVVVDARRLQNDADARGASPLGRVSRIETEDRDRAAGARVGSPRGSPRLSSCQRRSGPRSANISPSLTLRVDALDGLQLAVSFAQLIDDDRGHGPERTAPRGDGSSTPAFASKVALSTAKTQLSAKSHVLTLRVDADRTGHTVRAARHGRRQGFLGPSIAHQDLVYGVALRVVHDDHAAEDVAQDAFVRAYRALRRYPPDQVREMRLWPWLARIALNAARNEIRGRKAVTELDDATTEIPSQDEGPIRLAERSDERRMWARLLSGLPDRYRLAVALRYVDDLSYPELAETLGRPLGSVKSDVHRGTALLRAAYDARQCAAGAREAVS